MSTMDEIKYLVNEIEEYCNEANYILDHYETELENTKEALQNTIHDLGNFRRQLSIRNLMTPELEEFIELYLKFYND